MNEKTQKVIEELQKEMKESENRMKAIDAKDTEKQWNELMIWTTLKHTVTKLLAE